MSAQLTVHGGMRLAGSDPSVKNLDLEHLLEDPVNPSPGRVWYNETEGRVKYVEGLDGDLINPLRSLVHTDDLINVVKNDENVVQSSLTLTTSSIAQQVFDTFLVDDFGSAKYLLQVSSENKLHMTEVMIVNTPSGPIIGETATLASHEFLVSVDTDIEGAYVRLLITPTYAVSILKAHRVLLRN